MGNVNAFPVLSQVKSLGQAVIGNAEGARLTQEEFSKLCPVISQTRSLVHVIAGDQEQALYVQQEFGRNLNIAIDSVPVIGHIKGGVHYVLGATDDSEASIKRATKSIGIFLGGAAGLVIGAFTGAREGAELSGEAVEEYMTKNR